MSRYIKLPNSTVFDADRVEVIARSNLNEYIIAIKDCPIQLKADATAIELLEKFLGVTVLEAPSQLVAA